SQGPAQPRTGSLWPRLVRAVGRQALGEDHWGNLPSPSRPRAGGGPDGRPTLLARTTGGNAESSSAARPQGARFQSYRISGSRVPCDVPVTSVDEQGQRYC